jgi:hypothetical protein
MKKVMKKMIIFLLVASCAGYAFKSKHVTHEQDTVFELKKVGEKEFIRDLGTLGDWAQVTVANIRDTCFFIVYNAPKFELFYYDYHSTRLVRRMDLSLMTGANGFYMINNALYFYNYEHHELHVTTLEGELQKTINIPIKDIRMAPSRINLYNGVYPFRDDLYMACYSLGETISEERFTCMKYNTVSKDASLHLPYPEIYDQANWGGENCSRWGFTCFNPKESKIIFSFPVTRDIVQYDCNSGTCKSFYAESDYIDSIPPVSMDKSEEDFRKTWDHFSNHGAYGAIVYDPYRELYYRIATLPSKDPLNKLKREVSLILLDRDFRKIGETFLGDRYASIAIATPEGILVPYFSYKNEPNAPFTCHIFEICKK